MARILRVSHTLIEKSISRPSLGSRRSEYKLLVQMVQAVDWKGMKTVVVQQSIARHRRTIERDKANKREARSKKQLQSRTEERRSDDAQEPNKLFDEKKLRIFCSNERAGLET